MITISISDGTYTAARTGEPEDTASSVLARVLEDLAKLRADDEGIEHAADSALKSKTGVRTASP